MHVFLKIIVFLGFVFLAGCGGGGGTTTENDTSGLSQYYHGKTTKAYISEDNYIKYIQYLHYMIQGEVNDNLDSSMSKEGRSIENHINNRSGIGYILYKYNNFHVPYSEEIWNGTIRIDITDINQNTGIVKTKNSFNLNIENFNDHISIQIYSNIDFNAFTEEITSLKLGRYRLTSEKDNETIEIIDMTYNANEHVYKGKIYIESEGYVDFINTANSYIINGSNPNSTRALYSGTTSIQVTFGDNHQKTLYYNNKRVSEYIFPIIEDRNINLMNQWNDTNLTMTYRLSLDNNTSYGVRWYVNYHKIDDVNISKLSRKYFRQTDNIKAILGVCNHDACTVKTRENYIVPNSAPIIAFPHNNPNPYNSAYIIQTDNLEIPLDQLIAFDVDGDPFTLEWSTNNPYVDNIEIKEGTERSIHPTIIASGYGVDSIHVNVVEDNHLYFSESFTLDIRTDLFNSAVYQYNHFDNYSDVRSLAVKDLNNDGLKDILVVVNYLNWDHDPARHEARIEIFHQKENGTFDKPTLLPLESIGNVWKLHLSVNDFDNDGLLDIIIRYKEQDNDKNEGIAIYAQGFDKQFSLAKKAPLGKSVYSLHSLDFNNDGSLDYISLINEDGTSLGDLKFYYTQNTNNEFDTNRSIISDVLPFDSQLHLGDFNGDGHKDILVSLNASEQTFHTLCYSSTFLHNKYLIKNDINNTFIGFNAIAVRDFNSDGYDDVIFGVGNSYEGTGIHRYPDMREEVYIMYSSGNSGILTSPEKLPLSLDTEYNILKIADINNDNHKDFLQFKSDLYSNEILTVYKYDNGHYRKYPRALFAHDSLFLNSDHIVISDINNDGKEDVIMAPNSNGLIIGIAK